MTKRMLISKLMDRGVDSTGTESREELREVWIKQDKRGREISGRQAQNMTKKELSGQLRLYGIDFKSSLSAPKLRELLVEGIQAGKVVHTISVAQRMRNADSINSAMNRQRI